MATTKRDKRTVVKGALKVLKLIDLQVDHSYQREVKAKHKKIVAEFNEEALGIPVVGERADGSLWIVDGLQRCTALKILGKREVRAEVFPSKGAEHEAEVFKLINMNRTKLQPAEEFRALLTAHDADAWAIKNAVESCGFTVNLGGARGGLTQPEVVASQVSCINTLREAHRKWGVEPIKFALNTIKTAWPGDPFGVYNVIVGGLSVYFNRYQGVVDVERLIPRLQTATPQKIMYTANQLSIGSGSLSEKVAEVIEKISKKRSVNTSKRGS